MIEYYTHELKLAGQTLILHPLSAIYWPEEGTLIIADVHYGKAGHFRKAGIPVSGRMHLVDIERIDYLIQSYKPQTLLILGDLFHSVMNDEWYDLQQYLETKKPIELSLVPGNHDILEANKYSIFNVQPEKYFRPPFVFSHEPIENNDAKDYINICGHIHPCVRVGGKARQSDVVKCFYFDKKKLIMPAFGNFTGSKRLKVEQNTKTFLIIENQIVDFRNQ